jgi:hypothetical protein
MRTNADNPSSAGLILGQIVAKYDKRADPIILTALVCGATAEQAGAKAGVSARTVRRRLRSPAFRRKLSRLRTELQMRTADQLSAAGTEAVRTLLRLMNPTAPPNTQLGAARSVVELGMKSREHVDLIVRVNELEQRLAEQTDARNGNRKGRR